MAERNITMSNNKYVALKVNWGELGYHLGKLVNVLLNRDLTFIARYDDEFYWDLKAKNGSLSIQELQVLLSYVNANRQICTEAIPIDSDETQSLGKSLSEALIMRLLNTSWKTININEDGLWLVGLTNEDAEFPSAPDSLFYIDKTAVNINDLMSEQEFMEKFAETDGKYSDISEICEVYVKKFGNELVWQYPISDERYSGGFFVLIKEGVLFLPYIDIENCDEIIERDGIRKCNLTDVQRSIFDWRAYSSNTDRVLSNLFEYLEKRGVGYGK